MRLAILRRSIAAAAAITLLTIPSAFADTVDGFDSVATGFQSTVDLGAVQPGSDSPVDVYFKLTCGGTSHVNSTQAVRLVPSTRIVPSGGGYSVGTLTFGLGSAWPADGEACPADLQPTIGGPLHVIVTAPMTPGLHYRYTFSWSRNLVPTTPTDSGTFSGTNPQVTIYLDVPAPTVNTPPQLQLPADSTVEGNTTGGALAAYTVTATAAEDAVAPTPACLPAIGSLLSLGPNTITCTATDSGGLQATGSFQITVVDTTDPVLHGMPGDVALTTTDPGGAALTYTSPTATDIVDGAPTVQCAPVSGSIVPVGDTPVTCTATDASGNTAAASFAVHVTLIRPTPPQLQLPADSTVEGNTTGGALAAYTVTATDAEDAVAPTPACLPAIGSLLSLGPNTITCTATDSGGLQATGSFQITVVDTTDPVLHGMPGDVALTTTDPGGATLTYTSPTATDIVDGAPTVQCAPVSGSIVPVGDTPVTCTATDASGNTAAASFAVHVTLIRPTPPQLQLPADSTVEGN